MLNQRDPLQADIIYYVPGYRGFAATGPARHADNQGTELIFPVIKMVLHILAFRLLLPLGQDKPVPAYPTANLNEITPLYNIERDCAEATF